MKILLHIFSYLWILCPFNSTAQEESGKVVFLKNSMAKIVAKEETIEKVADGFKFIEGPIWHKDGYLLFSDIPSNRIHKYIPEEGVSIYIENSGFVGSNEEKDGPGSNGLTFDKSGNLIICQHGARQVVKYGREGRYTPVARQYGGKRLNSPNDVVVKSDGSIFFTDPPWGLPKQDDDPAKELMHQGIYSLKKGNLQLLDGELKRPNGITFSPDENYLYVSNLNGDKKEYLRYEVDKDGNISNRILFFDASSMQEPGGPDGIKVDSKGNCYFTGPGGVLVITPKGEHIGTIAPPELPANIGWGGKEGKTLFMTCQTGLYSIELKIEGSGRME